MSKKDDEINRQLIFNSGGANPEDYLTPKQLQRYLDNPDKFIDIDIDLAMNKEEPNYEGILNEAFTPELKKTEPPTLIQYIRSFVIINLERMSLIEFSQKDQSSEIQKQMKLILTL